MAACPGRWAKASAARWLFNDPKSPWVNQPLQKLPIHSEYKLLVAAARQQNSADFIYNPDGKWIIEPGQTLIVLGRADDVKRAREAAQTV